MDWPDILAGLTTAGVVTMAGFIAKLLKWQARTDAKLEVLERSVSDTARSAAETARAAADVVLATQANATQIAQILTTSERCQENHLLHFRATEGLAVEVGRLDERTRKAWK